MCTCPNLCYACVHISTHIYIYIHLHLYSGSIRRFRREPGEFSLLLFFFPFVQQRGILEGARPMTTRSVLCALREKEPSWRANFTGKPSITRITRSVLAICGRRAQEKEIHVLGEAKKRNSPTWTRSSRRDNNRRGEFPAAAKETEGSRRVERGRPIRASDPFSSARTRTEPRGTRQMSTDFRTRICLECLEGTIL